MASYLPIAALCAALSAYIARSKERSVLLWFFAGLFGGPLGVIVILFLGER